MAAGIEAGSRPRRGSRHPASLTAAPSPRPGPGPGSGTLAPGPGGFIGEAELSNSALPARTDRLPPR